MKFDGLSNEILGYISEIPREFINRIPEENSEVIHARFSKQAFYEIFEGWWNLERNPRSHFPNASFEDIFS